MDNKKFISYMGIGLLGLMVISLAYFIGKGKDKDVSDYKIYDNTYYTGSIVDNKLEGEGTLKSIDGLYKGEFKNSRFDGPGTFIADDYSYMANFDHKSGNNNIKIKLKDGSTYEKTSDGFVEVEKDED